MKTLFYGIPAEQCHQLWDRAGERWAPHPALGREWPRAPRGAVACAEPGNSGENRLSETAFPGVHLLLCSWLNPVHPWKTLS